MLQDLRDLRHLIEPNLFPFPLKKNYPDIEVILRLRSYLDDPDPESDGWLSPDNCWLWQGPDQKSDQRHTGSPYFNAGGNKRIHPQRLLYRLMIEDFPPAFVVEQRCRQRYCCNPTHFKLVDRKERSK